MPSPFPGMDPYLEGYLWPDVHHRLATEITRRLGPLLRPRYVARLEVYLVQDESPEAEIGILYPDVEILKPDRGPARPPQESPRELSTMKAPVIIPVLDAVEARLTTVEIRDAARNELVACIEILSPVNKHEPGVTKYRQRRDRLYRGGVHLLEIDLLRRGTRPLSNHPQLPEAQYLITLTRSHAPNIEVWPLNLKEALPALPVPLREPDPDARLDLSACLAAVYDEAGYDLSVDYALPPPPPLTHEEGAWVRELIGKLKDQKRG